MWEKLGRNSKHEGFQGGHLGLFGVCRFLQKTQIESFGQIVRKIKEKGRIVSVVIDGWWKNETLINSDRSLRNELWYLHPRFMPNTEK